MENLMLTNAKIVNLKAKTKSYKISDGEGLFLVVSPSGTKCWRLKYRFADKEKTLSLGKYPEIGLLEARQRKFEARALIRGNKNPVQERRNEKNLTKFI
ncbi:MAG: DUF4102 domain-containing protein, partial [Cytophagaceae bacterium]